MYDVVNMPDLVERFFSSRLWLGAFVVSVIYLFFRLDNASKRAVLAAAVAFLLVINSFVIEHFTMLGENSTFYRHLWAIPSVIIIGIAMVDLVGILPKWFFKITAITAFAVFLYFANQEYIRCRSQFLSIDAKLVPEDVIILGDELERARQESNKTVVFVVCPVAYERSYGNMVTELGLYSGFLNVSDSSFFSDSLHNGEEELTGETPDVEYIMGKCCANGIDFVIVSRNEKAERYFSDKGYDPVIKTNSYVLYRAEGYFGYKKDLNRGGQISWKYWFDEKGEPCVNENGIHRIEYKYDRKGRTKSEIYKDLDESIVNCIEGYARSEWYYYDNGVEEVRLYDAEGNPCVRINHGYGIIRFIYNRDRQLIEMQYCNEKGQLINYDAINPRAVIRFEYDNENNQISEKYFDKDDIPSKTLAGYDEIRKEYAGNHIVTRIGYYADGKLINRTDTGFAEVIYENDENGESIRYLDRDGAAVILQE